jgi:hypothetical protein
MALSRFHWLFVVARNSSFTYKGRAVDVKQVGPELGVRYVLVYLTVPMPDWADIPITVFVVL